MFLDFPHSLVRSYVPALFSNVEYPLPPKEEGWPEKFLIRATPCFFGGTALAESTLSNQITVRKMEGFGNWAQSARFFAGASPVPSEYIFFALYQFRRAFPGLAMAAAWGLARE